MQTRAIKLAWIAECSRHYEKGNLLYEGQRPVALRVCVTRSGRVSFLRRRLKNAECINRGVRYPGRCPGLWAVTGLTARHTWAANAVKSFAYMNLTKLLF